LSSARSIQEDEWVWPRSVAWRLALAPILSFIIAFDRYSGAE
jgi:hypothetical protein